MFDYKSFAESMKKQSSELIPTEFNKNEADFIKKTVYDFVIICGKYLNKEQEYNFTDEQKVFITQLIAEWSFHKSVDLINSKIPQEYWEAILQKIAFTILEVVKQAIKKELPQDEILMTVEYHIIKCYKDCIDKLQLNDEQKEIALEQSSIDTLATSNPSNGIDRKSIVKNILHVLMLFAVGISSAIIAFAIFPHLPTFDSWKGKIIILCLTMFWILILHGDYYVKNDVNKLKQQTDEADNLKKKLRDLVNPDRMYERLGVDVLSLQFGEGLLCIADVDKEGKLLPKMAAMRQRLTDTLGYIIPNIRVMDTSKLEKEEYAIGVRDNIIDTGFVYPNKYMVIADNWKLTNKPVPQNAIIAKDPIYKTEAYWLDEEDVKDLTDISATSADDVIIQHLEEVFVQQVDLILSEKEVQKYIQLADSADTISISDLLTRLSYEDIRQVFVNLIREKYSIRDIILILSRLTNYSRYNKEPDILSEQIRKDLSRQISLTNCNTEKIIYAINLAPDLTTKLLKKVEYQKGFNKTKLLIDEKQEQDIVEQIATKLMQGRRKINCQPVILCDDKLRLALYRLLVRHIPTIIVLAESEIEADIKLEIIDKLR